MHIRALEITNFKGIKQLHADGLRDLVIIAGPNGCGKSAIYDALTLLKSTYGGYRANEQNEWYSQFKLDANLIDEVTGLLQDPSLPATISAKIELTSSELDYIRRTIDECAEVLVWRQWYSGSSAQEIKNLIVHPTRKSERKSLARSIPEMRERIEAELRQNSMEVEIQLESGRLPDPKDNLLFSIVAATKEPDALGVFELHGANRSYQRQSIVSIDLRAGGMKDFANQSLYDLAAKYVNVKTILATAFLRQSLAEQQNEEDAESTALLESARLLFRDFLNGKELLNPKWVAGSKIVFPVKLPNGATHDIDDLSSGEKEIAFGYLRLKHASPRNSVLLFDEPELHMNPRMQVGLAAFYRESLGKPLMNQIWLITHSDTILRDGLNTFEADVFHMIPASEVAPDGNQLERVTEDSVYRAIVNMIGEATAYVPGKKIVVFEGGGEANFDIEMCRTLFPELMSQINAIPGGGKVSVSRLRDALSRLSGMSTGFKDNVWAIRDKDFDTASEREDQVVNWDRYHIENYLMDEEVIAAVVTTLGGKAKALSDPAKVSMWLRERAMRMADDLAQERLTHELFLEIREKSQLRVDPTNYATSCEEKLQAVCEDMAGLASKWNAAALEARLAVHKAQLREALEGEGWRSTFPGRSLIGALAREIKGGLDRDMLRSLLLHKLREMGREPASMRQVLQAVLDA